MLAIFSVKWLTETQNVWRIWGTSSDILGFRQSFYTENGQHIWLLCWTFCLTILELLVRHFPNSSDMSDVTDGFREACDGAGKIDNNITKWCCAEGAKNLRSHMTEIEFCDPPIQRILWSPQKRGGGILWPPPQKGWWNFVIPPTESLVPPCRS